MFEDAAKQGLLGWNAFFLPEFDGPPSIMRKSAPSFRGKIDHFANDWYKI